MTGIIEANADAGSQAQCWVKVPAQHEGKLNQEFAEGICIAPQMESPVAQRHTCLFLQDCFVVAMPL